MTLPNSDSFSTYGGEIVDFSSVEDPNTDLSAEASNQLRASAAGISNTCFRVQFTFHLDGYGVPQLTYISAVYDTEATADPVLTRLDDGKYQATFPTEVTDLRGTLVNLVLLGGVANPDVENNGDAYFCTVQKTDVAGNSTVIIWCVSAVNQVPQDRLDMPINVMLR